MFNWLKKTASKADDALDQAKKSIDASEKSVKTIVNILGAALIVSIITNVITIGANISNKRNAKGSVIIHNLYLGVPHEK